MWAAEKMCIVWWFSQPGSILLSTYSMLVVLGTVLSSCFKVGDVFFKLCASVQYWRRAQVMITGIGRPRLRRVSGGWWGSCLHCWAWGIVEQIDEGKGGAGHGCQGHVAWAPAWYLRGRLPLWCVCVRRVEWSVPQRDQMTGAFHAVELDPRSRFSMAYSHFLCGL